MALTIRHDPSSDTVQDSLDDSLPLPEVVTQALEEPQSESQTLREVNEVLKTTTCGVRDSASAPVIILTCDDCRSFKDRACQESRIKP